MLGLWVRLPPEHGFLSPVLCQLGSDVCVGLVSPQRSRTECGVVVCVCVGGWLSGWVSGWVYARACVPLSESDDTITLLNYNE